MTSNQMTLLLLSAGLFDMISSNVIPTKEEQANLLTNVQEVLEQVKLLVNVEANSTKESVIADTSRIVETAKDKVALLQELLLTKISCVSNSVYMLDFKEIAHKRTEKCMQELNTCVTQSEKEVTINLHRLTNATSYAIECGQNLLNVLHNCSRKSGLNVIACYRSVIQKDVVPVKKQLLEAMEAHKKGHFRTIEIRNITNACVDNVTAEYETEVRKLLNDAIYHT